MISVIGEIRNTLKRHDFICNLQIIIDIKTSIIINPIKRHKRDKRYYCSFQS